MPTVTIRLAGGVEVPVSFGPDNAAAAAAAALASRYANDDTDTDVVGGVAGSRGAKYWSNRNLSLFSPTRNLFNGTYHPWRVDGGLPGTGVLYNDDPLWRTAVVPVQNGVAYYVKSHDPAISTRLRIAVHNVEFPEFNNAGAVVLTQYVFREDALDEYGFTSPIDGWAFITISHNSGEPRLQVEEGSAATDYIEPLQVRTETLPERIAEAPERVDELFDRTTARTRNLFSGVFRTFGIGGVIGSFAQASLDDLAWQSAWAPIETGKTYTIKVAEAADAFAVAVHTSLPPDLNIGETRTLTDLLETNSALSEYTFTAAISGFVMVFVSFTGQSPAVQIEEGSIATDYVPYLIARQNFVDEAIADSPVVKDVQEKCACALERLDQSMLFPSAANVWMTATDPGPRFVEYFDGKMWGYTFANGDLSYSVDEGVTWTAYTNLTSSPGTGVDRLLPAADGEVLLMADQAVFKSSGWAGGTPTWSASKVTVTPGATLFQFAFDGDGTKFILAEYGSGTPNWQHSRKVWISTDAGNTFNVVWDSLTQHGSATNAETHLHGVVYDRFADRFYISEGHGPKGGLYCSEDDGATWLRAPGYHNGVLKSENVWPNEGDTNGPTILVATSTGLVMGSDGESNGVFGLVRQPDPLDELVRWIYKEPINGGPGVAMFAVRGWLDEISDTAYINFRSERNDQPPIICAGNPTEADVVYRHPTLPVVGASDQYGAIAKTSNDRLVAYAQFDGSPFTFRADLDYPASGVQSIVRAELKKLGLI